jgi:hypothetical protein
MHFLVDCGMDEGVEVYSSIRQSAGLVLLRRRIRSPFNTLSVESAPETCPCLNDQLHFLSLTTHEALANGGKVMNNINRSR